MTSERERVLRLVQTTRAIRWWIDSQVERGQSDEQIAAELPVAVAFITGRIGLHDLRPSS